LDDPASYSLVKQPGCEADPSPPFSLEVKKVRSYTATNPVKFKSRVRKISFTSAQLRGKAKCMISSPEPLESACQWVIMEKSHDNHLIYTDIMGLPHDPISGSRPQEFLIYNFSNN
jgi:hypothetical protein